MLAEMALRKHGTQTSPERFSHKRVTKSRSTLKQKLFCRRDVASGHARLFFEAIVRFMTASKTVRPHRGQKTHQIHISARQGHSDRKKVDASQCFRRDTLAIGIFRWGQVDDDPPAERGGMLVSTSSIGCPTVSARAQSLDRWIMVCCEASPSFCHCRCAAFSDSGTVLFRGHKIGSSSSTQGKLPMYGIGQLLRRVGRASQGMITVGRQLPNIPLR
ncbi:hypothetical protein QBC36DRAFT_315345 [Triangularia setosa]|uniref:Uncharacterized protein n=1 Tax=Triangularia setosa TaxID=2587417 RepID=A0AAN6VY62_9PEZI|nr:hypothetical protein QBC36DRAFT_315345 [Podospora setosa]